MRSLVDGRGCRLVRGFLSSAPTWMWNTSYQVAGRHKVINGSLPTTRKSERTNPSQSTRSPSQCSYFLGISLKNSLPVPFRSNKGIGSSVLCKSGEVSV